MIVPDFKAFKKNCRQGNLTAVTLTVPGDLETPVSSFLKLAKFSANAFLLESAEQDETIGRYSIIGIRAETLVYSRNSRIYLRSPSANRILRTDGRIVDSLREILGRYRLANPQDLPGFKGGFVGYLSYENVKTFEDIRLAPSKQGPCVPEAVFFLTGDFLIFDHYRKQITMVALVETSSRRSTSRVYRDAVMRVTRNLARLKKSLKGNRTALPINPPRSPQVECNMTRRSFQDKVRRIREYIKAGDCIQVVLSHRFRLKRQGDDFSIYRALRSVNPSPYMFYFRYGKVRLIGSSPELLVKKTGSIAEVRPIAGTRPRGRSPREDALLEESLKKSAKEMAEHLMLVDLGRNDLGRVCRFNSVAVKNFARVERYSHVMHLVSDVVGRLRPGMSQFDLLKACFPAGTVTGAPKIRAMQIIDELEPEKRGPYAGCVGYFGLNLDMDMCIAIRTLVVAGDDIYLQAGAGIVKDSLPAREYQETVNKAKALMKAICEQGKF